MIHQEKIQAVLRSHYSRIKIRNSSYTLRAFAQKIGMSSGALSEILQGRRRVSKKMADRIADSLMLDPQERSEVLMSDAKISTRSEDPSYLQLTADQFHAISNWYHFALLSLMKTVDFSHRIAWMAKRLGIAEKTVELALNRLERLQLIRKNEKGLKRTGQSLRTTDEVVNLSVRKSHFEDLDLARGSLESDPIEVRDFTSITMAIDPKKMQEAKTLIRKFQDQMSELLETSSPTEVYKMTIALFPLTKINSNKESSL